MMHVHFASRRARAAGVWQAPTAAARLARAALLPAELIFRAGSGLFHARYERGLARTASAGLPVISVGNLTVGGTGKTPVTRWLVAELRTRGRRPAVLHGGYGLDEPALHRAWHPDVPVIVERDRVAAAAQARERGADVLVLDDGFQHRRLRRDLDIVLMAAEQWTAARPRLPRGPWREGTAALRRAGVVLVTRKSASLATAVGLAAELAASSGRPAAVARLAAAGWQPTPPAGQVVLVTAVADWRSVATMVEDAGVRPEEALVFPDHHAFDAADAERIRRFAGRRPVVCTEKDWIKLRALLPAGTLAVLHLDVVIESGADALHAAIDDALTR